ncbi:hypothetical protein ACR9E3_10890 [Actinomycetospora sp. C-140]
MGSNAWERAQEAIAHAHERATERDEDVITPDTAVSPFDASATTVLPHGLASRAGPQDPDLTQRIPHGNGHANGNGRPIVSREEPDDARTVRFRARGASHPGTSPFPASPFPTPTDGDDGAPDEGRPGTGRSGDRSGDRSGRGDETPADERRRPWWRRLFGG